LYVSKGYKMRPFTREMKIGIKLRRGTKKEEEKVDNKNNYTQK